METASQILQNTGNANLAYGTANGLGTGAPVGVLDIGKDNGFDTLATYQMLKKKDEFDAMKKEADDLYKSARDLDLSTDKLLEIDRTELVNNYIPKITEYLTKHPYSLNPKTPEQVKENLEIKRLIDDFKDAKAKAQTRYVLKPQVDKAVAESVDDREGMTSWYTPQFDKPLGYVTPYKKLFKYDKELSKGGDETTEVEIYDPNGTTKTKRAITTNIFTTYNKANSIADGNDANINKYIKDNYDAYLKANAMVLEEKANLVQQGKSEEAEKIQPYLTREINAANNYITDYNTLHPNKIIPLFSTDKPLDPRELFLLENIIANVKQTKISENQNLSDKYKFEQAENQREELVRLKAELAASNGGNESQGYIVNALTTYYPSDSEELKMYNNATDKYKNEDKTGGQPVFFGEKLYPNQEVHYDKETGRVFTKLPDGKLLEYIGSSWVKAKQSKEISIDDKILKNYAPKDGIFKEAKLDGNRLKLTYTVKGDKGDNEVYVFVNRMDYLKNIADNKGGYDATMKWLKSKGITNLNDDAQYYEAVKLILANPDKGAQPQGGKTPEVQGKEVKGKSGKTIVIPK